MSGLIDQHSEGELITPLWRFARRNAQSDPESVALVDALQGNALTWKETVRLMTRRAGGFLEHGLAGKTVVLLSDRSSDLVVTLLGASLAGVRILPFMSPRICMAAYPAFLKHFEVAKVICSAGSYGEYDSVIEKIDVLSTDLDAAFEESESPYWDELYINHTNGSSGTPKFVVATHEQVEVNGSGLVRAFKHDKDLVHLSTLSSHPHDLFHRAMMVGGKIVLVAGYPIDPRDILDALQAHSVTTLRVLPLMAQALGDCIGGNFKCELERLEITGASVDPLLTKRLERLLDCRVIPTWGSTETTGVALASSSRSRLDGVGWPIPGYTAALEGAYSSKERPLELSISSVAVANGYLGQESRSLGNGTFRSGDLAIRLENGAIEIVGRTGSRFKVGGFTISPEIVAKALVTQASITDAIVIPATMPDHLEPFPLAIVTTNDAGRLQSDILTAVKSLDSPTHQCPRWLLIVDEIPNHGGKPSHDVSRQLLNAGRFVPDSAVKVDIPLVQRLIWMVRDASLTRASWIRNLVSPVRVFRIARGQYLRLWCLDE